MRDENRTDYRNCAMFVDSSETTDRENISDLIADLKGLIRNKTGCFIDVGNHDRRMYLEGEISGYEYVLCVLESMGYED